MFVFIKTSQKFYIVGSGGELTQNASWVLQIDNAILPRLPNF